MRKVLVTGASGFIGSHLVPLLSSSGWEVLCAVREKTGGLDGNGHHKRNVSDNMPNRVIIKDLRLDSEWEKTFSGVDVVVHLAGLAHDIWDRQNWTHEDYMKVNAKASETIAKAASKAGVKRFIYISTIKINGEQTPPDKPFDELSPPDPKDPYSQSKYAAEKAIKSVAAKTGLDVVIIRSPLVYGSGVKGNMKRLVSAVAKRSVMLAPSKENLRNFIFVGNIADAIKACMENHNAGGETFVVADSSYISTSGLIKLIADSMGKKIKVAPIPEVFLSLAGKVGDFGQKIIGTRMAFNSSIALKLQSSLRVDSAKIIKKLNWTPPYTIEEGVKKMVQAMEKEEPFLKWLNVYYLLAVPVAWIIASVFRYDYFLTTGGMERFLYVLPVVMASQYAVYRLMGFSQTGSQIRPDFSLWDSLRVALVGTMLIGVFLFLINRLEGVSRTAFVLYPVMLATLINLPRVWIRFFGIRKLEGDSATDLSQADSETSTLVADGHQSLSLAKTGATEADVVIDKVEVASSPAVSVIIVNFNAGELLSECVLSALRSSEAVEVIVSDNGSTDGSVQYLRKRLGGDSRVNIIENNANLGFARANNQAMSFARGDYMLFLNPDCIIEPDTLEHIKKLMLSNPEVGMAGCLIQNLDGSEQAGCRRMVPTPWRTFVRIFYLNKLFPNYPKFRSFILANQPLPESPVYIEALSGAFMFVRKTAIEDVGPLDDGYFVHCEDLDWCMRFRMAGWKILFAPKVEITHIKGTCSRDRPFRVLWHKHRGMIRFYRKFFKSQYPNPLMWLVIASVWARFSLILASMIFWRSLTRIDDDDIN